MSRIAVVDGVTSPLESATVSVEDRGFLYGDSVFETMRTYSGVLFALERHLERLERSAGLAHIPMPLPREALARELAGAVASAGNAESYVRVMVTRGRGELGLDPGLAGAPSRVVIVTPLVEPPSSVYKDGITASTFGVRRAADGTGAEGAKLGNYLVSVLAMRAARAASASEALIVDGEGRVVEGATSNVFFVERGSLVTPPEEAGILAGITRAVVLDVAREAGIPVSLRSPSKAELGAFDEMFISSSIRELVAVVGVDGVRIGEGKPGPVYRRLLAAFRAKVHADGGR
jgi:branched-chain amino acid aminotransferase